MTALRRVIVAFAVAVPLQSALPIDRPAACQLNESNRRWVQRALDGWDRIGRNDLRLSPSALPWIVLYDDACAWHLAFDDALLADSEPGGAALLFAAEPVRVRSRRHAGSVWLPDGSAIPASQNVARASLYRDATATFFVVALPEMWKRDPRFARDVHTDDFFLGVAIHELTHTRHLPAIVERLTTLATQYQLPNLTLDDDLIQNRFGGTASVRRAWEAERDLLYQAVAEPDAATRAALVARALAMARQRRARTFTGANRRYMEFEDLFLSMEGAGQWAAYKLAQSDTRPGEPDAVIIDFVRSTRRYWSQEEGLALFLLLDRMVPDWQAQIFGHAEVSAFSLLEMALRLRTPSSP